VPAWSKKGWSQDSIPDKKEDRHLQKIGKGEGGGKRDLSLGLGRGENVTVG